MSKIQQMYIAYYGRAADPDGLATVANAGGSAITTSEIGSFTTIATIEGVTSGAALDVILI